MSEDANAYLHVKYYLLKASLFRITRVVLSASFKICQNRKVDVRLIVSDRATQEEISILENANYEICKAIYGYHVSIELVMISYEDFLNYRYDNLDNLYFLRHNPKEEE